MVKRPALTRLKCSKIECSLNKTKQRSVNRFPLNLRSYLIFYRFLGKDCFSTNNARLSIKLSHYSDSTPEFVKHINSDIISSPSCADVVASIAVSVPVKSLRIYRRANWRNNSHARPFFLPSHEIGIAIRGNGGIGRSCASRISPPGQYMYLDRNQRQRL